ncbi:hypothetical protein MPSEU_000138200 [Mayamaea pseudoterrestris]|nr:hypothetical protein MPSEU_000138200 [Mayamaea pseudoterrestris]
MSTYDYNGSAATSSPYYSKREQPVTPRRLELSVDPTDGSLLVSPLTQVLLASTDALYSDFYNMAHGELEVVTMAATGTTTGFNNNEDDAAAAAEESNTAAATSSKIREQMSNLSFAQRRHELVWRLHAHTKSLTHVAALTASNATTALSRIVSLCGKTLRHAHSHWQQADEAQDMLYFFHGQLFSARAPPHDLFGALDVMIGRGWYDLPSNLKLSSNATVETQWSKARLQQEWELVVRRKLVNGEVGWRRRRKGDMPPPLWKLIVRGGIVRLVYGTPKNIHNTAIRNDDDNDNEPQYPIMALLTVFSSSSGGDEVDEDEPTWTLLSLDVSVHAKTGEFTHQLESSHRQRYDLHRLAARAMAKQEVEYKQRKSASTSDASGDVDMDDMDDTPAQPLQALFEVAHTFALSWQLELLSAQAQALRRGVWGAVAAAATHAVHVDPVRFFDGNAAGNANDGLLGAVTVSFWRVDDSFGAPSMGELTMSEGAPGAAETHAEFDHRQSDATKTSQLRLIISAQVNFGIRVLLSGGRSMLEQINTDPYLRAIGHEIIESTSNPLELSVSNALLAATRLCAVRRCSAVVKTLQNTQSRLLPSWMMLTAHRGSIAVTARIDYHGYVRDEENHINYRMSILFRLECDTRTGSFTPTFSRQTKLLGELACNSETASESMSVRIAALPSNRRRAAAATSSGRAVRQLFDGLVRSMNILGERIGIGGEWDDFDDKSSTLRERAILSSAADVKLSLTKCCGAAALYGLTPIAVGAGLGLGAVIDAAGDPVPAMDDLAFLPTPPISVFLDQELIEAQVKTDAVTKKTSHVQQNFCSFVAAANDAFLKIVPLHVSMTVNSPFHPPTRTSVALSCFKCISSDKNGNGDTSAPPIKRVKLTLSVDELGTSDADHLLDEVRLFASIITATIDFDAS